MRRVEQQRPQPHADLGGAGLVRREHVVAVLPQPDRQQPGLGGLARALAALEGDQLTALLFPLGLLLVGRDLAPRTGGAPVRGGRRARGRQRPAADRGGQVRQQRHARPVVHLPVRAVAEHDRDDRGQQQHDVVADRVVVDVPDLHVVRFGQRANHRRERASQQAGQRDHAEHHDPQRRLQERERAAAGVVIDLPADDGVRGDVGDAGQDAEHDNQEDDHGQVRDEARAARAGRRPPRWPARTTAAY